MKVIDVDNLFCAGEKAGLFIGHTEAMITGALAGYNAIKNYLGYAPFDIAKVSSCWRHNSICK